MTPSGTAVRPKNLTTPSGCGLEAAEVLLAACKHRSACVLEALAQKRLGLLQKARHLQLPASRVGLNLRWACH